MERSVRVGRNVPFESGEPGNEATPAHGSNSPYEFVWASIHINLLLKTHGRASWSEAESNIGSTLTGLLFKE